MTTADSIPYRATDKGGRKHLAQCPHLVGSTTRPVRDDEHLPVCDWCAKELSGHGRRYYDDLGQALEAFRAPLENRRLILDELRHVEHDQIWMPYSGSYVALGLARPRRRLDRQDLRRPAPGGVHRPARPTPTPTAAAVPATSSGRACCAPPAGR